MENRAEFIWRMILFQVAVSIGFLASRLINGMPFFQALGMFTAAVFLGGACTLIAVGVADAIISAIKYFKTRNK